MSEKDLTLSDHERAAELLDLYGHTSNDYFKIWPDKSYWFSSTGNGFVAYGVSRNKVALSLGDPVAPEEEIELTLREFRQFCKDKRWIPVFHQATPKYWASYKKLGYQLFKGSEDAIVDLEAFTLSGKDHKSLRNMVNRMNREGFHIEFYDTPIADEILTKVKEVSDSWLSHGRRERTFTLGRFDEDYVRHTPLMVLRDAEQKMHAFVNLIPSFAPDTATIDMMRYRVDAEAGAMDYLFIKLFEYNKELGFRYFSLGPAPIISPKPDENASLEEKAFYRLTHYLDTFFSMKGLRAFKEKYATIWEPRYMVYRRRHDLPRIVAAINDLCELDENKKPLISRQSVRQFRKVSVEFIHELRKNRIRKRPTINIRPRRPRKTNK